MYLAGSFLLMLAVTLVIGNLLADVLLAQVDPRVRYD
jgi:peptide/nickel transport system permease protein